MSILQENIAEAQKQESLASLVKRLGNPESTTLLQAPCHVFQIPQIDGAIGYHRCRNCAVVIGDPICLPQDVAGLSKAFDQHCQEANLTTVYLLVHDHFAHWAIQNGFRTLIQVGSELSINPTAFQQKQKLRWKINQAIQLGVTVNEYTQKDPFLEEQIKNTMHTWVEQRRGPQIHLGKLNFFNTDSEKRIFVAQQTNKVVGLLVLSPVDRYAGWVVSAYLAVQGASIGTTEHLMGFTFDTLAKENCHYLCLGAVSGIKLGEMVGLSTFGKILAKCIFKMARWSFKLDAKSVYFNKFQPHIRPTYFICKDKLTLTELLAIKHVLNVKLC